MDRGHAAPDYPHLRWFEGAQVNITVNALDRHARGPRANKVAYIALGEDGSERIVTYRQLLRLVNRFANVLRESGVGLGDRVVIYMPLSLEGIIAMLACARIGAIHCVVYAGLGAGALRDRIVDADARLVITADVGYRRGKAVQLKPIVDEAHRRAGPGRARSSSGARDAARGRAATSRASSTSTSC